MKKQDVKSIHDEINKESLMSKKIKLTKEAIEYLGQWAGDGDGHGSYSCMYENGYYELCADYIAGSGAIKENNNEEEKNIKAVAASMSFTAIKRRTNAFFKTVKPRVLICNSCNHHAFFDSSFESTEELMTWSCGSCLGCDWTLDESPKEMKKRITDYLENECAFRDYRFSSIKQYGKLNVARSINLKQPTNRELQDAVSVFARDGYSTIIIYI